MSIQPRAERVMAFTVVTPDLDASIAFWRDAIGYALLERGLLADPLPMAGRGFAFLQHPDGGPTGVVRLLQAEPGDGPNRPRPGARAWDPGLAVLELGNKDPEASYARLTEAGAPTLSPPLPYQFRNAGALMNVDVQSYAAFGPAGEQLFITYSERTNAQGERVVPRVYSGLHGPVGNAVIPTRDRVPILAWYEAILGVAPTVDEVCEQETVNEIIGAPKGTRFQMIMVGPEAGKTIGVEIEEYYHQDARRYPTDLNRTGLAMITIGVDDLGPVRDAVRRAGMTPTGEGAFPLPGNRNPEGFILRGIEGELVEVVEFPSAS